MKKQIKRLIHNFLKRPIKLEKYVKGASCPVCEKGVLMGSRDQETFQFLNEDRCLLCGQLVVYEDIKDQVNF